MMFSVRRGGPADAGRARRAALRALACLVAPSAVLGCSGDATAPAAGAVSGSWAGVSQNYTLALTLRGAGTGVSGTGWFAAHTSYGQAYESNSLHPVRVSGRMMGTALRLTVSFDPGEGGSFFATYMPDFAVEGTAGAEALDLRFTAPLRSFDASGVQERAQAATFTRVGVADSTDAVSSLRGEQVNGGVLRFDVSDLASMGRSTSAPSYPKPFWIHTPRLPALHLMFASRPAPGTYPVVASPEEPGALVFVTANCTTSCSPYRPLGAGAGEVTITRSTPRAVSGTFRFRAARRHNDGTYSDTVLVSGTLEAACGLRVCG